MWGGSRLGGGTLTFKKKANVNRKVGGKTQVFRGRRSEKKRSHLRGMKRKKQGKEVICLETNTRAKANLK